jgi:hypothetical protein
MNLPIRLSRRLLRPGFEEGILESIHLGFLLLLVCMRPVRTIGPEKRETGRLPDHVHRRFRIAYEDGHGNLYGKPR